MSSSQSEIASKTLVHLPSSKQKKNPEKLTHFLPVYFPLLLLLLLLLSTTTTCTTSLRSSVRSKAEHAFADEAKAVTPGPELAYEGLNLDGEKKSKRKSATHAKFDKAAPIVLEYDAGAKNKHHANPSGTKAPKSGGFLGIGGKEKGDERHCFFCKKNVTKETNPKIVKGNAICMSCRMEGRKLV